MDILSPSHLIILLIIVLIIFGPSKLGDVGGAVGKAVKDFKRAMNDDEPAKVVTKAEDPAKTTEIKATEIKADKA
ncbi:MAG TPA: twin-arginine translocase TatA/TatE family subunit [Candidatus Binataceae bacterium]|nr:twin-arginine translocase TatA/TatE family subunit [Candidatus Binataceae bacterium]